MKEFSGLSERNKRIGRETKERRAYVKKNPGDFSPNGDVFILVGGALPVLHLEGWYFTTVGAAKRHANYVAGDNSHLKTEICRKISVV